MPDRTPDDMLRFRLVKFAERWAGTPYTLGASVEGVGADCLNWIQGFLLSAGVLMPPPSDQYPELPSAEEIESGEAGAFLLAAMDEAASRAAPGFRCS